MSSIFMHKAARALTQNRPALPKGARRAVLAALGVAAILGFTPAAAAQSTCSEAGKNEQCTAFGTIAMDSQRDIRGDPIDVAATIVLNTAYGDQGARWLLFSVRNVTEDGSNPVTISLTHFATSSGDIVTTRVEHPTPNELNLWVDVLDTPVGTPINLEFSVGSTERGAYRLETLVMAFDRGYAPVQDNGSDASLFSFTLLGVNRETAAVQGSGSFLGHKVPAFELLPAVAALAVATLVLSRRRFA